MTKKHFVELARVLRCAHAEITRSTDIPVDAVTAERITGVFTTWIADACQQFNPHFDTAKFHAAVRGR